MLTGRDTFRAFAKQAEMDPVADYMGSQLITSENDSVSGRVTRLMMIKKIRTLPVTDKTGTIVGFFNLRDLISTFHISFCVLFEV